MDLIVTPNVTLKIKKVEVLYGITANVTFTYQVNDERSKNQEIGLVYGKEQYPGQRTAMNITINGIQLKERSVRPYFIAGRIYFGIAICSFRKCVILQGNRYISILQIK